ncbi:hypothetical protein CEP51_012924, partial [Fusarium floridanum]
MHEPRPACALKGSEETSYGFGGSQKALDLLLAVEADVYVRDVLAHGKKGAMHVDWEENFNLPDDQFELTYFLRRFFSERQWGKQQVTLMIDKIYLVVESHCWIVALCWWIVENL